MSLHINHLPDGILRDILEYLRLDDRKSASLVCRLWDQEAFSTRLMATVQLRVSCTMLTAKKKSLEVLQNSCRRYRNLLISICGIGDRNDVQYVFIVAILDMLGSTIEKFTLKRQGCSLAQLRDFVNRMPNLKHLTTCVTETGNRPTEQVEFPVLVKLNKFDIEINRDELFEREQFDFQQMAPNVQQLRITCDKCDYPERIFKFLKGYAAQLHSVDIFLQNSRVPIDEVGFEQLRVLRLRGRSNTFCRAKLFYTLSLLTEAYLDFAISRSTLEIICKNCPKLMILEIRTESLEDRSFQCFEELTNLKVISVNYLRLNLMKDCKPVMSVVEFHMHMMDEPYLYDERYIVQFHKVFPNLQNIKVYFRGFQDTQIIDRYLVRQLCRKFIHLRKLTLNGGFCMSVTVNGFEQPDDLGNVEELTLIRANLCIEQLSLNNVKRLKLERCNPISLNVFRIGELFPKLRYLEIRNCKQITPDVITDIRRSVPDCVVHYVHVEKK